MKQAQNQRPALTRPYWRFGRPISRAMALPFSTAVPAALSLRSQLSLPLGGARATGLAKRTAVTGPRWSRTSLNGK
jgi:hypothetical protein